MVTSRVLLLASLGLLLACSEEGTPGTGSAGAGQGAASTTAGTGGGGLGGSGGQAAGSGGQAAGSGGQAAGGGGQGGSAGGGAGGTGGGGGAGGGLSLTLPIERGELRVLEMGNLLFAVDPSKGARIVSFKLDDDELLTGPNEHAQYYGSTLWTSPASDWVVPGTFVPPPVVDSDPYTTTVSAEGVITATSAPSTANGKQFVVTKVFHADLTNNAIVIDYQLQNTGSTPFQLSHWEVTRVFSDGLTFFPNGTMNKLDFLAQPVQVSTVGDYTWYDNTTHQMGQGESKMGTDSSGGFIAHVARVAPEALGDLLFIKSFAGVTAANAPPEHYPVELYCNDPHTYVELEDHSSYDQIAPGATYTRTVTWYLRRLPQAADNSPGSETLVAATLGVLGL